MINDKNKIYLEKCVHTFIKNVYDYVAIEAIYDRTKNGIKWSTISKVYSENVYERKISYSLLNGIGGIIVFLIEYYEFTNRKDEKCLELIELGIASLIDNYSKETKIGFYNGKGGYLFILLLMYNVTSDDKYLSKVLDLADINVSYSKLSYCNNIAEGASGYLLSLLLISEVYNNDKINSEIINCTNYIISNARITDKGVFWDQDPESQSPLLGFLKGNSGIVFVLKRLSKYLITPDIFLEKIIEEAILYEDLKFDTSDLSWPDYSYRDNNNVGSSSINLGDYQLNNSNDYWASGSIGFLISRELDKSFYSEVLQKNVNGLSQLNGSENYFLDGVLGMSLVLQTISESSPPFQTIVKNILNDSNKSSHVRNTDKIDLSLFNGETGKAYFLMLIYRNKSIHNLLIPNKCRLQPSIEIDVLSEFKKNKPYFHFKRGSKDKLYDSLCFDEMGTFDKMIYELQTMEVNWGYYMSFRSNLKKLRYSTKIKGVEHIRILINEKDYHENYLLMLKSNGEVEKIKVHYVQAVIQKALSDEVFTIEEMSENLLDLGLLEEKKKVFKFVLSWKMRGFIKIVK
ncbi:lanthionine synthetase LanC family protein [Flammeovirga aprica]|uniref:Lanthionine synthetase C-like protein n=1 Tax=Flammeovirga aprica JL-4 TaxID=694437 RepID=A0A7X9RSA6_9BACT|nr:lanthionine synthetase LanC family protein [Flammeovirga aprica]NME66796.1 hypothetical protein [Flammeovirga aprica JL-4]